MWGNYFRNCTNHEEYLDYPLHFPNLIVTPASLRKSYGFPTPRNVLSPKKIPQKSRVLSSTEKKFREISENRQHITPDEAARVLRELGIAPSNSEIAMINKISGNKITTEIVGDWRLRLKEAHSESDRSAVLKHFFEAFDHLGTGKLTGQQLYTLLTAYGDALTDEEAMSILRYGGMQSFQANLNYEDFCTMLLD